MRKERKAYKNNIKKKVLILILGILFLVGMIVFQNIRRNEKANVDKSGKQMEIQEGAQKKKQTEGKDKNIKGEDVPDSGTQKEEQQAPHEVEILNIDEYATKLMGENTELLNKNLTEWVEENQLNVTKGTIFHVMVPKSDPQSINFYIRLADERNSLVMLAYHPRENIVTASICNYTEEEIINEVWEGDNGPAVRDVAPEQDTGGVEPEAAEPEVVEQEGAGTDDITG